MVEQLEHSHFTAHSTAHSNFDKSKQHTGSSIPSFVVPQSRINVCLRNTTNYYINKKKQNFHSLAKSKQFWSIHTQQKTCVPAKTDEEVPRLLDKAHVVL